MRTAVVDGVELTVYIEQGDLLSLHLNQLAVVRFELARLRYFDIFGHANLLDRSTILRRAVVVRRCAAKQDVTSVTCRRVSRSAPPQKFLRDQILFGPAPAADDVVGLNVVPGETLLSVSLSAALSISIEPLKYAPSSMMICAVVKSPITEPSFLISILLFARTIPFTFPHTTTSCAMMSAVTFAVAPTVSFPSPSWTAPSTIPSMCMSSLPEISPFTCRFDPSRAVAPSGGRFVCQFFGSGSAACGGCDFLLPH